MFKSDKVFNLSAKLSIAPAILKAILILIGMIAFCLGVPNQIKVSNLPKLFQLSP